jgi:uroporphyrinogen III methyltransferase / synthase
VTLSSNEKLTTLRGKTILVTRTKEGNVVERKKLEALGARVLELPSIELGPPTDTSLIDKAIEEISSFEWIVFTSASGVKTFFERLDTVGQERELIKAKFACVGPQTQKALEAEGFRVSMVPKEFLTKSLGLELSERFDLGGKKVLLARSENANPDVATILREAGAIVVEAPVYKTTSLKRNNLRETNLLQEVTDITLTSPSTVEGLMSNFTAEELNSGNIRVHCIGPVTSDRAIQAGLKVSTTAREHTIDGLIHEIENLGD